MKRNKQTLYFKLISFINPVIKMLFQLWFLVSWRFSCIFASHFSGLHNVTVIMSKGITDELLE